MTNIKLLVFDTSLQNHFTEEAMKLLLKTLQQQTSKQRNAIINFFKVEVFGSVEFDAFVGATVTCKRHTMACSNAMLHSNFGTTRSKNFCSVQTLAALALLLSL